MREPRWRRWMVTNWIGRWLRRLTFWRWWPVKTSRLARMGCLFVDAYAGLIPGWECWLRKDIGFVERALRHAAASRTRQGHPFDDAIHHSDAGSQYTAIHYSETLMLEGLIPSIGTVGDALDNGLCETTIGLYKTECMRAGSPFRSRPIETPPDLEDITAAWVAWYNGSRAHAPAWAPSARGSRGRVLRSTSRRNAHRSHRMRCA